VKEGFSFLDAWRKFLETKHETGTQSYASALRWPGGVDVITERGAIPTQTKQIHRIGPSRTAVGTHTVDPSSPDVPGARMCFHL
jgi:hypothetical protein